MPTALRLLEGNRSHRTPNQFEPRPERILPKAPACLDREAKKIWKEWAPKLLKLGVLTETDTFALETLCRSMSRVREANKAVQEKGTVIKDSRGIPRRNPFLRVEEKAQQEVDRMMIQFGLTPASRTRIVTSGLEGIDTHMGSLGRKMAAGRKERPSA